MLNTYWKCIFPMCNFPMIQRTLLHPFSILTAPTAEKIQEDKKYKKMKNTRRQNTKKEFNTVMSGQFRTLAMFLSCTLVQTCSREEQNRGNTQTVLVHHSAQGQCATVQHSAAKCSTEVVRVS